MEEYEVSSLSTIDFGATGREEILQNVAFIISTFKDSCVLDRKFGWAPEIDIPIQLAEQVNIAKVIEAVQIYEPRATIVKVNTSGNPLEGNLNIKLRVIINE